MHMDFLRRSQGAGLVWVCSVLMQGLGLSAAWVSVWLTIAVAVGIRGDIGWGLEIELCCMCGSAAVQVGCCSGGDGKQLAAELRGLHAFCCKQQLLFDDRGCLWCRRA